jgi:hypothetical protein
MKGFKSAMDSAKKGARGFPESRRSILMAVDGEAAKALSRQRVAFLAAAALASRRIK